jgi:hypothetical protein
MLNNKQEITNEELRIRVTSVQACDGDLILLFHYHDISSDVWGQASGRLIFLRTRKAEVVDVAS